MDECQIHDVVYIFLPLRDSAIDVGLVGCDGETQVQWMDLWENLLHKEVEYHSPLNVIKAWCSKVGFGIKHMPRFSMHWKCLSLGKDLVKISMVIFDVETCLSWIYLSSTLFFKWSGIEFPHVYFLNGIWDFHLRLLHFDYHNGLWLDLIVKKKVHVITFKVR